MGTQKMTSDLRSISSPSEEVSMKRQKVDSASARRRFLARLNESSDGSSEENTPVPSPHTESSTSPKPSPIRVFEEERMGTNSDYESIRNAQILENKARLASMGLHKALLELRSKTQVKTQVRKNRKVDYSGNPRRCSQRLKGISTEPTSQIETNEKRPGLAPFVMTHKGKQWLLEEDFARLCANQSRGSIHHPIYGISCHICGEKKLCGEKDCKRCGDLDLDQPCIGKTDCSVCHSSKGIICRGCLKLTYDEEMEEARENKRWMCPHCIEDNRIICQACLKLFLLKDTNYGSNLNSEATGSIRTKSDSESISADRTFENQVRLSFMGTQKMTSDLRSISSEEEVTRKRQKVNSASARRRFVARLNESSDGSSEEEVTRKRQKVDSASTRRRFVARLNESNDGSSEENTPISSPHTERSTSPKPSPNRVFEGERMGMLQTSGDYESIRNAIILENKARLASMGLHKTLSELRSKTQVKKPMNHKVDRKVDYSCIPRRSSHRLKGISVDPTPQVVPKEQRLGLAPFVIIPGKGKQWLSQEEFAQHCASQSRGSIHHPIYGTSCHICGEKKLCGEEGCKRCGDLDLDQICIGKTDCSVCHFVRGVLCQTCLKVRYGEELEEVRESKQWMCPHCIEEQGIKPYWICNGSQCLNKRKIAKISNAAFKARGMGHKFVAHLLMEELQGAAAAHTNDDGGDIV